MGLPEWGHAYYLPQNLDMPARTRKAARVFVAPMSDLGHPDICPNTRRDIAMMMRSNAKHTYIVLTKRPGEWMRQFAPYAWIGVTAENQARYDERWGILKDIPAAVRFVSIEPMLGPVSIGGGKEVPSWVIAGPETGA
jgi:protein gp37